MSRSRRHSPFVGTTKAATDKPWKQQNARRVRRGVHQTLAETVDGDAVPVSPYAKGHGGWCGMKDGKQRIVDPSSKDMRK
ncbi:hypothetical protein GO308_11840 [Sphingomonas sp. SFZ2018-12]|uniref:hypothetical protein n=1 Tax=Sphingomonas sp. SFZ2018-12 TaxID=2683197 RepID=UPI001F0D6B51|nr:hypothetical protein [Sphingomonas sp. SFZ2018-12]MCH4893804.1 hypothetical protein [Sphingomonas sp. SFZ2018-12]